MPAPHLSQQTCFFFLEKDLREIFENANETSRVLGAIHRPLFPWGDPNSDVFPWEETPPRSRDRGCA